VPDVLVADLIRVDADLAAAAPVAGSLQLIGRRRLRSNNSWMHNSARLVKGPVGCTLLVHPDDAAARGLSPGGEALVRSRVGEIRVPVSVSDEVAPGVVCLPHGWSHASFNDLADDLRVDALCGNADFSGLPVTVEAAP